jgi:glycosyltransferase involved in cell wall biosynthesis
LDYNKRKIRVGIFPALSTSWNGGINYYKNLVNAFDNFNCDDIKLILFFPKENEFLIPKDYIGRNKEMYSLSILNKHSWFNLLKKVENKLFNTNILFEIFLLLFKIDIISHSSVVNLFKVKSISWIPDFQHIYLPQMFSKIEIANRNKHFSYLIKYSDAVIVSSKDSYMHIKNFSPTFISKVKVLNFACLPPENYQRLTDKTTDIFIKHNIIPGSYYYLPNQFWMHKNHKTAFEAIKIVKDYGKEAILVCTGNIDDYRNPQYFKNLKDFINSNKLTNNILVLGVIKYEEVYSLIKFSRAVINPSLFEGWSSTVEECLAVGKKLILSDINVHKEQAPNAIFFKMEDSNDLANIIYNDLASEIEADLRENHDRFNHFSKNYINILRDVYIGFNSKN